MRYQTIVRKVPGDGLVIRVCVSADMIEIYPDIKYSDELKSGSKYDFTHTSKIDFYRFAPEDYKYFWKDYRKSDDFAMHGDRMRVALQYALKVYRRYYGEIFA